MSEVKWTPGPWWLEEDFDHIGGVDHRVFVVNGPLPSGPVFCGIARIPAPAGDEMLEANARLIAAAPELFEALKVAMTWIDNWSPDFTDDPEWPADRDLIRAALSKASIEGEG